MSGNKEVDPVSSDASSAGWRVLEKAPKARRYVVSEGAAIEAFGKAFPDFAAKMRFLEEMRGWDRWIRKDLRRYRKDPDAFDFDNVWYEQFYEDLECEYSDLKEVRDEIQWATNASHPACLGPESGASAPPLGARRRVIRQRGADIVRTAEDQTASLEPPAQEDPRLSKLFGVLNEKYFEGLLPPVPVLPILPGTELEGIQNGFTRYRYRNGEQYVGGDLKIYLADSHFKPIFSNEVDRWKVVADTLLHEMGHLAVYVDALGEEVPPETGHDQRFTDECNRINQGVGGPEVHPGDGEGDCGDRYNLGCTLWPNRRLKEKYGPVLNESELANFSVAEVE